MALASLVAALLATSMLASPVLAATSSPNAATASFKVLVFSKTTGYRHDSIPAGIAAIQQLGVNNGFTVDATEDATQFTAANLAQYATVVFLSTTGDPLDQQSEKDAFQGYIKAGGGFVGIHAAADSGYSWQWYGDLVGAYFKQHPAIQQATVHVEDPAHPSTAGLPTSWTRTDEWYDYQSNPRGKVHVLTSMDQTSYSGSVMGVDHPNTWCQNYDGGRSWYTGLGHTIASFSEANFLHLVLGGIKTTAGVEKADCSASQDNSFQKVTLDANTSNPMMLDVAKDGRVFYIDLKGDVRVIKPAGGTTLAAHLNVFTANESGLLGLALDPNFATNHWIYLYYSPSGVDVDRLSRFTVTGDTLDMTSEKQVLNIPVQRAECCHHGGSLVFDKNTGNIYLAVGDNTNPFASDAYTPIDEQPGRSSWDAQRSAGNTNDLRGKVLRIHPEADGTYTVPAGNLFPAGTAKTKPEIYTMGERNPFRINVDPATGNLIVANYGPDAGTASATRGPENAVEWGVVTKAQNDGWPYCIGPNKPYIAYDFATKVSGAAFNCAAPVNNSPNNTGLTTLPAATPAQVYYHYQVDPANFPELSGGAPMAGPVYRYDPNLVSDRKWPAYWDGKAIFGEWNNNKLYSFQLAEDNHSLVKINQIFKSVNFLKPMDFTFGPDGALYMIEWGSGFGGDNADSGIYRIDYVKGNRLPIAKAAADKTSGPAPLSVQFSSAGSVDPDGKTITYAWDFNGDGTTDSTDPNPSYIYANPGNYSATLTVTSAAGKTATASIPITVGNTAPTVTITLPPNGGFFDFGDQVKYNITVSDPEDGTIDCTQVKLQAILGHATHGHPLDQYTGCSGTVQTTLSSGHSDGDNIFYVLEATYTDHGGVGGSAPLTGRAQVILQPKVKQAEFYTATGRVPGAIGGGDPGVKSETTTDVGGGQDIGFIEDGDYWTFDPINLTNIDTLRFRAASASIGAKIEVHSGAADGPLVGTQVVTNTGGWQNWQNFDLKLTNPPTTSGPLYFVVRAPDGSTSNASLLNVNWVQAIGKGVTDNQRPNVSVSATPTTGTAPLAVAFHSTATDPDGNTPLTYAWDFGVPGSPTPTTADADYTYTSPGDYQATVTVTDAKGAKTTEHVAIHVDAPNNNCIGNLSDDFTGTSLDTSRWTTVIRQNQDMSVHDGALHIPTSNTDIYGAGPGTTNNIVLQNAPSSAWQATTKVSLVARDSFEQAGLVLYGDDNNYAKIVLQARGTADQANRIFQFIREDAGNPHEVAASNTAPLGAAFPDTAYVRLTSDGTNITAAYSANGTIWTTMPETKALAGISNPKIGLLSLSGSGTHPVIDAAFDWFHLTPDPSATPSTPNDEFTGAALDKCRWSNIVREDTAGYRVTGGNLEIDTSSGDIYGAPNTDPKNFILQTAPSGDWTLETKVDGSAFNQHYHQGGIIVYKDDGTYVKLDYITDNVPGAALVRRIELRSETGDVAPTGGGDANNLTQGAWYLRLQKVGNDYHGFYSADGTTWTEVTDANGPAKVTNAGVGATPRVGLFAFGVNQVASTTAKFDYFHLTGAVTPPTETTAPVTTAALDPAAPNGLADWYNSPVTLTLNGQDEQGGSGLARTEYQLDGTATWTPYTAPVAVSADGDHAVSYRSVDKAGNIEATRSVSFKIDHTAPTLQSALSPAAPDGENGWYRSPVTLTASASDATSGVGEIHYDLDGNTDVDYTEPVVISTDGQYPVVVRALDKAGNTSSDGLFSVKIDGTTPLTTAAFAAGNDAGWHPGSVPVTLSATDATSGVAKTEWSLDGGAWQPYTDSVVASGDGTHELKYRSYDKAGNVEDVKAATLKIDGTAPTLLVSGVADGVVYGDSQDLLISWQATDGTSGIKMVAGTLDGSAFASGSLLTLYEQSLTGHTLVVTATDNAGNVTKTTVRYSTTTSFDDVSNLIDRFAATRRITSADSTKLHKQLDKAWVDSAKRKDAHAVTELKKFESLVRSRITDKDISSVLIRDSEVLIARLNGTA